MPEEIVPLLPYLPHMYSTTDFRKVSHLCSMSAHSPDRPDKGLSAADLTWLHVLVSTPRHTFLLSLARDIHIVCREIWAHPLLLVAEPPWPHRQGPEHCPLVTSLSAASCCVQEAGPQLQPKVEPAAEQEGHEQQLLATEHPGPPLAVPGLSFAVAASAVQEEDDYDAEE